MKHKIRNGHHDEQNYACVNIVEPSTINHQFLLGL